MDKRGERGRLGARGARWSLSGGQWKRIKDMCENGVGISLSRSVVLGERETCDWVRRMGVFAALCLIKSGFYTM